MPDIEVGSLKAVARYKRMLEEKGVVAENLADTGNEITKPHLLWMCNELQKKIIPNLGTGYSVDKYSRWLGFIQAGMIFNKLTTVKAERDITRGWFTDKKEIHSSLGYSRIGMNNT